MNTEAKHTPGPWVFSTAAGWGGPAGLPHLLTTDHDKPGKDEKLIASFPLTYPDVGGMKTEERRANARLISAAPDLLAALERLAEAMRRGHYPELQGVACDAFSAIARAKGEAP